MGDGPKRVAYFGGSFDPPHDGHLAISKALMSMFAIDEFVFVPAFHAPHKTRQRPTSAYDRYAMLCLATSQRPNVKVSRMEIEVPERPYSIETLSRLTADNPRQDIFFVMGADSWMDILTWRRWEEVLMISNHIVVTRPGYPLSFDHVTPKVRERIVDLRGEKNFRSQLRSQLAIYFTDAVNLSVSATSIRASIRDGSSDWRSDVPAQVAKYIEKYQIYS